MFGIVDELVIPGRHTPADDTRTAVLLSRRQTVAGVDSLVSSRMVDNGGAVEVPAVTPAIVGAAEVLEAFLNDCRFRNLSRETVRKYQVHGQRFVRFIEAEGLAYPPAPGDIQRFIVSIPGGRRTRVNYWQAVKSLFGFGRVWFGHHDPTLVMRPPQRPRQQLNVLSREQAAAIDRACRNYREQLIVRLILGCGLRRGEVARMRPEDIGTEFINVPGGKTGQRFVVAAPGIAEIVSAMGLVAKDAPEWLFPSPIEGHVNPSHVGRTYSLVAARAGIPEGPLRRAHTGRHFYATATAEGGVPVFALQRQLGHQSSKTTDLYTHHGIAGFADVLRDASPAKYFAPVQLTMDAAMLPPAPARSVVDEADPPTPRTRLRTRLFRHHTPEGNELDTEVALLEHGLSLRGLAKRMGVAYGTVFGIRFGRWGIGQTFVARAVAAFTGEYTYDQLFYEVQE